MNGEKVQSRSVNEAMKNSNKNIKTIRFFCRQDAEISMIVKIHKLNQGV